MRKTVFLTIILILAFCFQAYTQTCSPAQTGLVSWWSDDNNSLDSRSRNNGTLQNGATYASGKVGQGFSFDGVDDRVFVPHNANLNVANVTLEAWVFPTAFGGQGSIINKRTVANNAGYGLEPTAGGNISFFIFIGGNSFFVTSASQLQLNTWSHVAGTFDGNTLKVFINGVQDGSTSASGSIDPTTGDLVIGENIVNGTNWSGLIDEPTVYNRALSAIEIQSISNAGTAGKCKPSATTVPNDLVSWWTGDGNSNDFTGANNGTLQNGTGFGIGKVSQDFNFDGVDDYIDVGDLAGIDNASELSVSAWVKRTNTGTSVAGIIGKWDDATPLNNNSFLLYLGDTPFPNKGAFSLQFNDNSFGLVVGNTDIPINTWTFVTVTWRNSDGQMEIFKNGVSDGTAIAGVGKTMKTHRAYTAKIGEWGVLRGSQYKFPGQLDEIDLYNRALTTSEIQSIYNAGIAGKLKDNTTATGSNVAVNPKSDATVTFPTVSTAGITQQIPVDKFTLPTLPFASVGLTYDIATSAVYSGSPQVCFNLPAITNSTTFSNLRIYHLESNVWANRTDLSSINFATKTICTLGLTSLSPFAIVNSAAPTAANASVSGKILTEKGRGMARVGVILQNVNTGEIKQVLTNNFGRFSFEDLPSGDFYLLSVNKKGYQFNPNQQGFQLNENLADLNIVAIPFN